MLQFNQYIRLWMHLTNNIKMQYIDSSSKKFFFGLIALEIVITVLNVFGGSFASGAFMTLFRVGMLLAAHCCVDPQWASLYSVFALLSAIYSFDPVGLFITGHGKARTTTQNIACLIAFALTIVAAYIGYLYARALHGDQQGGGAYQQAYNQGGYNPPPANNNYFGGTNYMYQQPSNPSPYINQSSMDRNNNQFQAFSGQGYSLS